jgi:hypothetical protein
MPLKNMLGFFDRYLDIWMKNIKDTEKEPNIRKYAKALLIGSHIFASNTTTIVIPLYGFVIYPIISHLICLVCL